MKHDELLPAIPGKFIRDLAGQTKSDKLDYLQNGDVCVVIGITDLFILDESSPKQILDELHENFDGCSEFKIEQGEFFSAVTFKVTDSNKFRLAMFEFDW